MLHCRLAPGTSSDLAPEGQGCPVTAISMVILRLGLCGPSSCMLWNMQGHTEQAENRESPFDTFVTLEM
jgi:hypothetical protein